jgi:hypothetical protein
MRRLLSAIARAMILSVLVITLVESLGWLWGHPGPKVDLSDPKQLAAMMKHVPLVNQALVVLGWTLGPWFGVRWVTRRDPENWHLVAFLVGSASTAAGIYQVVLVPHPLWMTIAAFVVALPAALLGGWQGFRANAR